MGIVKGLEWILMYSVIISLIFGSVMFIEDVFAQQSPNKKNNDKEKDDDDRNESVQNRFNGYKIKICHIPPGNEDNTQTISVEFRSLSAHLRHGDSIGECKGDPPTCEERFAPNVRDECVPIPQCNGLDATIIGTEGRDKIKGTNDDDVIVTFGGNDRITAKDGNDTICAGDGTDLILGMGGDDWIDAGSGLDFIFGGDNDDSIFARHGDHDFIDGGSHDDGDFCQVDEKEFRIVRCEFIDEPYDITFNDDDDDD